MIWCGLDKKSLYFLGLSFQSEFQHKKHVPKTYNLLHQNQSIDTCHLVYQGFVSWWIKWYEHSAHICPFFIILFGQDFMSDLSISSHMLANAIFTSNLFQDRLFFQFLQLTVSSNVIIDKVAHDGFGTCVWKSIAEDRLCFSDGSFDGRFFMLVFCEQGLSMYLWSELWSGGRGRAATGYFSTVPWLLSGSNSTKTFFVWYVCIFLLLGL